MGKGRAKFGIGFLGKRKDVEQLEEKRIFYGVPQYLRDQMDERRRIRDLREQARREEDGEVSEGSRSTYTYRSKNSATTILSFGSESTFTLVTIGSHEEISEDDFDEALALDYPWSDEYTETTFTYESTSDKIDYVYTESSYTEGESYSVTGSTITESKDENENSLDDVEEEDQKVEKVEEEDKEKKDKDKKATSSLPIGKALSEMNADEMCIGTSHIYKNEEGEVVEVVITAELIEEKRQEEIIEKQGTNFADEDWFGNTKPPPKAVLKTIDNPDQFYSIDENVDTGKENLVIYGLDNEERRHGRMGKKKTIEEQAKS